jgi:hypothetical protein
MLIRYGKPPGTFDRGPGSLPRVDERGGRVRHAVKSRLPLLLIAIRRKLRPVLHLNPFNYFTRGLRDQTLNTLMPCIVWWPKIDCKLLIILNYLLTI